MGKKCLIGTEKTDFQYSNPVSELKISQTTSLETIESNMNTNMNGKGSFGLFSGSGEASYIREVTDTQYTLNFNYMMSYQTDVSLKKSTNFGEAALLDPAKVAF